MKTLFSGLSCAGSERMTDTQAKQINEMRMQGMGYKAIGMAIGLSRDIVRNYCSGITLPDIPTVVSKI